MSPLRIPRPVIVMAAMAALCASAGAWAQANNVWTVAGTANLFGAALPDPRSGTASVAVDVSTTSSILFYNVVAHALSMDGGSHFNDPDGFGSAGGIVSSGAGGLSGITAPNRGFLAGVFVGPTLSTVAPQALDFTTNWTRFGTLSPELQQTFFIGDGMTGGGGTMGISVSQYFTVPTGATQLYLGFVDSCGAGGAPGCYDDNLGTVTLSMTQFIRTVPQVPEPSSWGLMLVGLAGIGSAWSLRRRQYRHER